MTKRTQLAALLLASMITLGLTGCPRHRHHRDHEPPPPGLDHHDHNGGNYNH